MHSTCQHTQAKRESSRTNFSLEFLAGVELVSIRGQSSPYGVVSRPKLQWSQSCEFPDQRTKLSLCACLGPMSYYPDASSSTHEGSATIERNKRLIVLPRRLQRTANFANENKFLTFRATLHAYTYLGSCLVSTILFASQRSGGANN